MYLLNTKNIHNELLKLCHKTEEFMYNIPMKKSKRPCVPICVVN